MIPKPSPSVVVRPDWIGSDRHERTNGMAWALFSLLVLGLLLLGAYALLPLCLGPPMRYLDTLVQYVATPSGQAPVEWIVRLEIGGERVEARCLSEGEALRLKDAARRGRGR